MLMVRFFTAWDNIRLWQVNFCFVLRLFVLSEKKCYRKYPIFTLGFSLTNFTQILKLLDHYDTLMNVPTHKRLPQKERESTKTGHSSSPVCFK
jgi:hypothetical protein